MKVQYLFKLIVFTFQKGILQISCFLCSVFVKKQENLWVIGVDEIANYINFLTGVFEHNYSVSLSVNKFYKDNSYDFCFSPKLSPRVIGILRLLIGPILLGYLINCANSFFYIGNKGFLLNSIDGRKYEFGFIKTKNKKLITLFCGSDIRSLKLSIEHAKKLDIEVMASYYGFLFPNRLGQEYEEFLQRVAASADQYADLIFNAPVDQISYLKRTVKPIFYVYPDEKFYRNDKKFFDFSIVRIVHAPSSPIIKGTQLVRAAIKKLRVLGYTFEYDELIDIPNTIVLERLKGAHIVINELYAFVPGVFGIEAMASHCALITSADRLIEASLPEGANEAWLVTKYWEIFDNLKLMLDNPSLIAAYADKGFDWAFNNCRETVTRQYIANLINQEIKS